MKIKTMTKKEKNLFEKEDILVIPQFLKDLANEPDVRIKPIKTNTVDDIVFKPIERKRKRTDVHLEIKESISSFLFNNNNKFRKSNFTKEIIKLNPNTSILIIKRRIRKLFKQRFIEIDKTYKTKPFVIKGNYWRSI